MVKRIKALSIVMLFVFMMFYLAGCAAVAVGYGVGVIVKEHGEKDRQAECLMQGKVYSKGNSAAFKGGKCLPKNAGRSE